MATVPVPLLIVHMPLLIVLVPADCACTCFWAPLFSVSTHLIMFSIALISTSTHLPMFAIMLVQGGQLRVIAMRGEQLHVALPREEFIVIRKQRAAERRIANRGKYRHKKEEESSCRNYGLEGEALHEKAKGQSCKKYCHKREAAARSNEEQSEGEVESNDVRATI
eukprot:933539-Pelagomonas_calceolata.AAC.1